MGIVATYGGTVTGFDAARRSGGLEISLECRVGNTAAGAGECGTGMGQAASQEGRRGLSRPLCHGHSTRMLSNPRLTARLLNVVSTHSTSLNGQGVSHPCLRSHEGWDEGSQIALAFSSYRGASSSP